MKPIIYVAHPVTGDPKGNAESTIEWVRWFVEVDLKRIYIAPWVAEVMGFVGGPPLTTAFYQRVLDDDCEVVARCNGLIGVGGHWSGGMAQERQAARMRGIPVFDLTMYKHPPRDPSEAQGLASCLDPTWKRLTDTSGQLKFVEPY